MYAIKRERTGRILNENFDHEIETLSTFKKKEEAEAEISNRCKAQAAYYGERANFNGTAADFTVTIEDADHSLTEHFYIEEE